MLKSLTYAIILSSKLNKSEQTFIWFAMATRVMLYISKIPIITWVGSHEVLMGLTIVAKLLDLA
jgi:hypothetical protein